MNAVRPRLHEAGVELSVICAGSEGSVSHGLASSQGAGYFETENHPVSNKMNSLLDTLLRRHPKLDAIALMEDDDIATPDYFLHAVRVLQTRPDISIVGIDVVYTFDTATGLSLYLGGYRRRGNSADYIFGVTRFLRPRIVQSALALKGSLWSSNLSRYLDRDMMSRLQLAVGKQTLEDATFHVKSVMPTRSLVVNIKSPQSITPFAKYLKKSRKEFNNTLLFDTLLAPTGTRPKADFLGRKAYCAKRTTQVKVDAAGGGNECVFVRHLSAETLTGLTALTTTVGASKRNELRKLAVRMAKTMHLRGAQSLASNVHSRNTKWTGYPYTDNPQNLPGNPIMSAAQLTYKLQLMSTELNATQGSLTSTQVELLPE